MKASALHEIKHYQKQVGLIFSRSAFMRTVQSICEDASAKVKWRSSAIAALQYAAETALCMHFEMLYSLSEEIANCK